MKNSPLVVARASVQTSRANAGGTVARLISSENSDPDFMLGVCWMEPGESTETFVFGDNSLAHEGDVYVGDVEEIYYCLAGRFKVVYEDGNLEFGPHDAVHLPRGWRYRLSCIGAEGGSFVYGLSPAPKAEP
jgi:homogentisate 1,2-dioxygenase